MLVLTRKVGQTIHIGDGVVVKVVRTGKSSVKIGIEAPDDVAILRGELDPHVLPIKPEMDGATGSRQAMAE